MGYNFNPHARIRALERSENFKLIQDLENYNWEKVRYIGRFKNFDDADKLIYCERLELLGVIEHGLRVSTVVTVDSSDMNFVDGKYEKVQKDNSYNHVSIRSEVEKDLRDRRFER